MSGTTVFYNGIFLQDCEMLEFRQVVEMEESKTDHLWSKFRIKVASTLCRTVKPEKVDDLNGATPIRKAVARDNELPDHGSIITAMPFKTTSTAATSSAHLEHQRQNMSLMDISIPEHHLVITKFLKEPRKDFWMAIDGQNNSDAVNPNADPVGPPGATNMSTDPRFQFLSVLGATGMDRAEAKRMEPIAFSGSDSEKYLQSSKIERDWCIDANNGPKPLAANVQKIIGGRSMRIEFEIEVCLFIGPFSTAMEITEDVEAEYKKIGARKTVGVASNRWSVTESLDENWKTTHAIKGQLVVRDHSFKPHAQRMLTVPWMFPYAKMTRREFYTDPSGLTLDYQHTFTECGDSPPHGVVNWKGTYSEQTLGGGKSFGTVSVRVVGTVTPPNGLNASQYKKLLITQAFRIILSRLSFSLLVDATVPKPGQRAQDAVLQEAVVIEQMDEPVIDVKVTVLHNGKKEEDQDPLNNFGLRLSVMGDPIISTSAPAPLGDATYDRLWWPIPSSFTWDWKTIREKEEAAPSHTKIGSYFNCYYQSPEWEWHGIPKGMDIPNRIDGDVANWTHPYVHTNLSGEVVRNAEYLNFDFRGYGGDGRPLPEVEHNPLTPDAPVVSYDALNRTIQEGGFKYLTYDSKTTVNHGNGVVMLPLSKARNSVSPVMFLDGEGEPVDVIEGFEPKDTAVSIRLHAPMAYRDYTVIATRQGDWPKVPYPKQTIDTATTGKETLISQEVVAITPKPDVDDTTLIYGVECRWRYALSRPPGYRNAYQTDALTMPGTSGGSGDRSVLELGSNPMFRSSPANNQLPLAGFYDQSGDLYTIG